MSKRPEQINPCPFCGSQAALVIKGMDDSHWLQCTECKATGPTGTSRDDAIAQWNGNAAENAMLREIIAELARARSKFPGRRLMTIALVEEVGELAKATLDECQERVRQEAVQVAVMAIRCAIDGDESTDGYRAAQGLEPTGAAA